MDLILESTSLSLRRKSAILGMLEWALGVLQEILMRFFTIKKGVQPVVLLRRLKFHNFINYLALVDLPLREGDFTSSRSGEASMCLFKIGVLINF